MIKQLESFTDTKPGNQYNEGKAEYKLYDYTDEDYLGGTQVKVMTIKIDDKIHIMTSLPVEPYNWKWQQPFSERFDIIKKELDDLSH